MILCVLVLLALDQVGARVIVHHYESKRSVPVEFNVEIVGDRSYMQLPIHLSGKSARFLLDTRNAVTTIQCRRQSSVVNQILYVIKNPFKYKFNYQCPKDNNRLLVQFTNEDVVMTPVVYQPAQVSGQAILGLSKNSQFFKSLPKNNRVFCIWGLENQAVGKGKASIGGYNPLLVSGDLATIFSSQKDSDWNIWVDGVSINNQSLEGTPAIINFNYPWIGLPTLHYQRLFSLLPESHQCKYKGKLFQCSCESYVQKEFPTISLQLANQHFAITPEHYIRVVDYTCQILIEPVLQNPMIIGIPFFKSHMIILTENSIKVGNLAKTPQIQNKPTMSNILSAATILMTCVLGTIVIIELVRRFSGLAAVKEETIHEIIARGNVQSF